MKYGYKLYDLKKRMFIDYPNDYSFYINHNGHVTDIDQNFSINFYRNRFLKLMSTGKTDRNGIEIFEGAKVVFNWTDKEICHYVIKWDKRRCGFVAVYHINGNRFKSLSLKNLNNSDSMIVIGHVLERKKND